MDILNIWSYIDLYDRKSLLNPAILLECCPIIRVILLSIISSALDGDWMTNHRSRNDESHIVCDNEDNILFLVLWAFF